MLSFTALIHAARVNRAYRSVSFQIYRLLYPSLYWINVTVTSTRVVPARYLPNCV
jgi:hypothetical protein